MPREWILNSANMRWGLTRKSRVGAVSDEIRKCSPRTLGQWEAYYYRNVHPKGHLVELGRRLYTKVSEVLHAEIEGITEVDCIDYIIGLVINRTYDGYMTEKATIYGQLEEAIGVRIQPAPDEWDRRFNVDFFIEVEGKFIGLQIKPASFPFITQMITERKQQEATHEKFTSKYGGRVFFVISVKEGDRKKIYNPEVIDEIKAEIRRLSGR